MKPSTLLLVATLALASALRGPRMGAPPRALRSRLSARLESVARPPSDKQVKYAQRLSKRTEKPIPLAALEDSMQISAYIESALRLAPPTEKKV